MNMQMLVRVHILKHKENIMDIKWHSSDEKHMQVREKNGVTFLTYPAFENLPEIIHCFSTRLGGVSEGIFSSMNLSFTRGDNENAVKENYRKTGCSRRLCPGGCCVIGSDSHHECAPGRGRRQRKRHHPSENLP